VLGQVAAEMNPRDEASTNPARTAGIVASSSRTARCRPGKPETSSSTCLPRGGMNQSHTAGAVTLLLPSTPLRATPHPSLLFPTPQLLNESLPRSSICGAAGSSPPSPLEEHLGKHGAASAAAAGWVPRVPAEVEAHPGQVQLMQRCLRCVLAVSRSFRRPALSVAGYPSSITGVLRE